MNRIVLTGGGTAGHVTPNIALFPRLKELNYDISYMGSHDGIEKTLIEELNIPYYGIDSGKLRRYFDIKNFTDPFRVLKGYHQAKNLLKKLSPDVVFSKGGFVTVPVVLAASHLKIPVVIHESDITPGLANKICIPAATKVCCNFPDTLKYLPENKAVLTGSPIRRELLSGNKIKAADLCNFTLNKPVIMVVGGSSGSAILNDTLRGILPELIKEYQIIHLCGKGKADHEFDYLNGYKQFEYADEELCDLFALSDLVISRAGANSICELLALNKPNILIPLSAKASRGDQILNAASFEAQGFSYVLPEEELSNINLLNAIHEVLTNANTYISKMKENQAIDSVEKVVQILESVKLTRK